MPRTSLVKEASLSPQNIDQRITQTHPRSDKSDVTLQIIWHKILLIFGIMTSSSEERHGRTRILAGIGT